MWLRDNGWPAARRQPLTGSRDQGDIVVCDSPRIIVECKAGAQTETASVALIGDWLAQTEAEAVNAGADLAVLVVRRFRRPVQAWDAWMVASDWALLLTGDSIPPTDAPWPLRASLADWARMTREWADAQ
jgi:hypothetical protein